jgi:16S rRNA (adenine1518-N6/adenine1519-N6)-dimethyltransferase
MTRPRRQAGRSSGRPPGRRLGQHFLVDREVAARIVAAAELHDRPPVLEIGAGRGALTDLLRTATDRLYLVEIDPGLVNVLLGRYQADPAVSIIEGDVLAIDLPQLSGEASVYVVGNLPYSVASQILLRLVELRSWCPGAVVMLQEEVARRVAAKPGGHDYGVLTLLVQLYADVTWCFRVSRRSFSPMPRVESAVIRLHLHATPRVPVADLTLFQHLVRSLFQHRRKMVRNTLGGALATVDVGAAEAVAVLREAGIDANVRPQQVSLEKFAALTAAVSDRRQRHHEAAGSR